MRSTRQPVRMLPHRAVSGLFRTSDGVYTADIKPDAGKRIKRRLGTDKARALARFDALLDDLAHERTERENPRLADYVMGPFLDSQRSLKAHHFASERVRAVVRFLNTACPNLRLSDVTPEHARSLTAFYAHLSPRTRNGNLQKLKQALNHAVDAGLLDANPLARVKGLRFDNRRMRVLDMDELIALVNAARGDVRDIVLVLALTGLRPSNVFALRKDEMHGDTIQIPPDKMKNGRWGVIPVSAFVADLLRNRSGSHYVFPSPKDPTQPYGSIKTAWGRLVRVTGCDELQVYDLRHFYASQLAKLGATEQQTGRLLCHVGQSVTSRYVHHDIDDLRPFVERLSQRFVQAFGASPMPEVVTTERNASIPASQRADGHRNP